MMPNGDHGAERSRSQPPPSSPRRMPLAVTLVSEESESTWVGGDGDGDGYDNGDDDDGAQHTSSPSGRFDVRSNISRLHILCDEARENDEESWDRIRSWLSENRDDDEVLFAGGEAVGDYGTTPLHLSCRNCPPEDVVSDLLGIAPHTVRVPDSFSWLPLHYACANGASIEVLRLLTDRFPESMTSSDKRGRTPLHFALGNVQRPAGPEVVELLSSTGAAACADENGMLPLHYACAYGISREALEVLTTAFPESVIATDKKGRTPLHFALGNADRAASPAIVQHLLSKNPEVVNRVNDDGQLPLHLLSTQARRMAGDAKDERAVAQRCLELYLDADPLPTAGFFTALQSLPTFLRDMAVVTPFVQHVLNDKISKRFPTMILMLDFYFIVAIIVCFSLAVRECIEIRVDNKNEMPATVNLVILYIGGTYFLMREVVQVISLASLGLFNTWLVDGTNWLDVSCILIVFFWTIVMSLDQRTSFVPDDAFYSATAICTGFLYILIISYLKSTLVDFAVFVDGVFYVVKRLAAFLMALTIILIAFAQMFVTVFRGTDYCTKPDDPVGNTLEGGSYRPFCTFSTSFLKVYTMLLGEVSEEDFVSNGTAIFLFVVFNFLVVILLSNVLIAIVTDSYGVIKNERAQIVFWSNRLDSVTEFDLISSGRWKKKLMYFFCCCRNDELASDEDDVDLAAKDTFGHETWKQLLGVFDDHDLRFLSFEFWCYFAFRVVTALFLLPMWFVIGIVTAGFLWPPQVREFLFVQKLSKLMHKDTLIGRCLVEIDKLQSEVEKLQGSMKLQKANDRHDVDDLRAQMIQLTYGMTQMNSDSSELKAEVTKEMKQMREIMAMLLELQTSSQESGSPTAVPYLRSG